MCEFGLRCLATYGKVPWHGARLSSEHVNSPAEHETALFLQIHGVSFNLPFDIHFPSRDTANRQANGITIPKG